jgi:hypothetical protein
VAGKTPAQKLLMKEGYRVLFVHPPDDIEALLGGLPSGVTVVEGASSPIDFILVFSASRQALESDLPRLKDLLQPSGLLWVAYHKGTSRVKSDINRDSIAAYAQTIGMTPVSLIAIDDDWSALRVKQA